MDRAVAVGIGSRLKSARKESGHTQKDVAAELRLSRQSVSAWERGESLPALDELMALAILYGQSSDYLLFGMKTIPASSKAVIHQILQAPAPVAGPKPVASDTPERPPES